MDAPEKAHTPGSIEAAQTGHDGSLKKQKQTKDRKLGGGQDRGKSGSNWGRNRVNMIKIHFMELSKNSQK